MGYWGTVLLTRSPLLVTELPSLELIAVRHKRLRDLGDGWQLLETSGYDDPPELRGCVDALVAAWAEPVLAAYVTGGACAGVYAAVPCGRTWYLHLPEPTRTDCPVAAYSVQPLDVPVPIPATIHADGVAWAAAAGLTLSPRRLDRILGYVPDDTPVSAVDLVYELVRALGFPTIPWPLPYRLDPDGPPFNVVTGYGYGLATVAYARRAEPAPWKSAALDLARDIFNSLHGGPHSPADLARRVRAVYEAAVAAGDSAAGWTPARIDDRDPPCGLSFVDAAEGDGLWPEHPS